MSRPFLRVIGVTGLADLNRKLANMARLDDEVTAHIGTNLVDPPYPYFLEYGTVKMEPRPSARPAFFAGQHEATEAGTAVLRALFAMGQYSPGAVKAAARAMALPIENHWKRFAPVKTGTYRRSIHTEVE